MSSGSKIKRRALVLALASCLTSGAGAAQEPPEDNEHVVTTTAGDPEAIEDPRLPSGFVTSIPLEDADAGQGGLPRALEGSPGLYVRRQSSYGQPAYLQVRGGNPRQVTVLLDGARVKVPAGLGFDVGGLSVPGLREVRVYRGASGIMHGAGALTGALELKTYPSRGPDGVRVDAKALAGSFGTGELGASALARAGAYRGRVSAGWRSSKGSFGFVDEQGTPAERVNNDHERVNVNASGVWEARGQQVGMTVVVESGESGVAGPSEFQRTFSSARLKEDRAIVATDVMVRDVFSGQGWGIDVHRVVGVQARRQRYDNPEAVLGAGSFAQDTTFIGMEFGLEFALYTAAQNYARVKLGALREAYDASSRGGGEVADVWAMRRTQSVTVSDEQIFFGGKLSLNAAARFEHAWEQKRRHRRWPAMGAVGFIARPGESSFKLMGNFGRTYRLPDFDEYYLDTEFIRGDANLRPERAWLADLGARLGDADSRFGAELVGFVGLVEDQIAFLPVSAYLFQARNLERVESKGLEVAGRVSPISRLALRANYTFTDATRPTAGGPLVMPNQPRHRADVSTRLDLSRLVRSKHAELYGRAGWRSEITLDAFGSKTNPGWVGLDVGASASIWRGVSVAFDATNLLDHRRAVDGLQRPLPGRAFYLSARWVMEKER